MNMVSTLTYAPVWVDCAAMKQIAIQRAILQGLYIRWRIIEDSNRHPWEDIRLMNHRPQSDPASDFLTVASGQKFRTVLADPPWRFINRTGKVAPEHRRLSRYDTMDVDTICSLPVAGAVEETAHLYLWVPNALLPEGLMVLKAWGFQYKSNIIWHKIRKDGGSDGRGVGFYFRNVTEIMLFGVRGKNARTQKSGRTQVNYLGTRKREHSRKPDEQYPLIEGCSPGPYIELFARGARPGWTVWGNQADETHGPTWKTYSHNSMTDRQLPFLLEAK